MREEGRISVKGKDVLSIYDLSSTEVFNILEQAKLLKAKQKNGEEHHLLRGKTLGMIFNKASTRTRVSFEVGMWQLGGSALYLNASDLQIGRGEPAKDTARILSRYVDGIMIRTYSHEEVVELAQYSDVPVINGLTDYQHPCQALTDIFTAWEYKGSLKGKKLAYIGDGNNMAHSLMHACAKVGMNVAIAAPNGFQPDAAVVAQTEQVAAAMGSNVVITADPVAAACQADVLYTDVWCSMGQEAEAKERRQIFAPYQLNSELLKVAQSDAIIMHCLPAHRGEEITEEVMEGPQSVIFDQAENRLHVQKAIMALTMGN